MRAESYDAVVVGAGVMGCAAAAAAATAGARVLVLERFERGHDRGSSHGTSRIFRLSYPQPRYVELALAARADWEALQRAAGRRLLVPTGGLDRGPDVAAHAAALDACEVPHELLTGDEVARRWPALRPEPDETLLYQPDGAMIAADATLRSLEDLATARSACFRRGVKVEAVEDRGGRAVIATADGARIDAAAAVVTAGAWTGPLLERAGISLPLRPTRETVVHLAHPGDPPPAVVQWGAPSLYALASPGIGLKAAEHQAGPTIDPDVPGPPDEASISRVKAWVERLFPDAGGIERVETCLYTNAPGDDFIVERRGAIVIGSACSGHGFKFAPTIGRRLAALALGRDVPPL